MLYRAIKSKLTGSLPPFSEKRSERLDCVFGNAIPKSGTFLLNALLEYLSEWEVLPVFLRRGKWLTDRKDGGELDVTPEPVAISCNRIRNGQAVSGHMEYSASAASALGRTTHERRLKHLFMFRDPRDQLSSYVRFVTTSEEHTRTAGGKAEQEFFNSEFNSNAERLTYLIEQGKYKNYLKYDGWLDAPNVHKIRFEELYADLNMAGAEGTIGETLISVIDYLEVKLPEEKSGRALAEGVLGVGRTFSTIKKKEGQYREMFEPKHYELLDNEEFRGILQRFGYEWDDAGQRSIEKRS